jgi:putative membrane protein
MKTLIICCVVAAAAVFSSGCSRSETTSNTGPDKTSLSGTPEPINASSNHASNMTNSNMTGSNARSSGSHGGPNDFLIEAANGGLTEVELGRLASTKAQNAEVKRFGQMMITDHGRANNELKALAANKKIALPTRPEGEHAGTIQKLQGLSGAEFDRAYVDEMVEDHEKDVMEFEHQSQNASDADTKAFAAKTLPTLRKHLETIKGIQAKLK